MGFLSKLKKNINKGFDTSYSLSKKPIGGGFDLARSIIDRPIVRNQAIPLAMQFNPVTAVPGSIYSGYKLLDDSGLLDRAGAGYVGNKISAGMDWSSKMGVGSWTQFLSEPEKEQDGSYGVNWNFRNPLKNSQAWADLGSEKGYYNGNRLSGAYKTIKLAANSERSDRNTPQGVKTALDFGADPTMYIPTQAVGNISARLGLAGTKYGKLLLGGERLAETGQLAKASSRTARIVGGLIEGAPKTAIPMALGAGAAAEAAAHTPWKGDDYLAGMFGSVVGGMAGEYSLSKFKTKPTVSNIITDTYGPVFRDFKQTVQQQGVIERGPKIATGRKWIEQLNKAGITKKEIEWNDLNIDPERNYTKDEFAQLVNHASFDIEERIAPDPHGPPPARVEEDTNGTGNGKIWVRTETGERSFDYIRNEQGKYEVTLHNGDTIESPDINVLVKDLTEVYGTDPNSPRYGTYTVPGDEPNTYREILIKQSGATQTTNNQWDYEPNVLMHLRVGDRDGGRTLFVHEVQSDWAQENRSGEIHHVTSTAPPKRPEFRINPDEDDPTRFVVTIQNDNKGGAIDFKININKHGLYEHELQHGDIIETDTIEKMVDALSLEHGMSVPDRVPHPFQDNWQTIGVKRLLRYAAENGYEKIELARGEDTLKIPGMGLAEGSDKWWGRINSYNGSKDFIHKKDYEIVEEPLGISEVSNRTISRFRTVFKDPAIMQELEKRDLVEWNHKPTTQEINQVMRKSARDILEKRPINPGTGLHGIAEGLANQFGFEVEKRPRVDGVDILDEIDPTQTPTEWKDSINYSLQKGDITPQVHRDLMDFIDSWVILGGGQSGWQVTDPISLKTFVSDSLSGNHTQRAKEIAQRFVELMGYETKNKEGTPSTIINLIPSSRQKLLSSPQTMFGVIGDDQGFEAKIRDLRQQTMSADPTEGGKGFFGRLSLLGRKADSILDPLEQQYTNINRGRGLNTVERNGVANLNPVQRTIEILRNARRERLAAMQQGQSFPQGIGKETPASEYVIGQPPPPQPTSFWQERAINSRNAQSFDPNNIPAQATPANQIVGDFQDPSLTRPIENQQVPQVPPQAVTPEALPPQMANQPQLEPNLRINETQQEGMITPPTNTLPPGVAAGEAVDRDIAWQIRSQQARDAAAAGQDFTGQQIPPTRDVQGVNRADPFSPPRPPSNELTELGRPTGPTREPYIEQPPMQGPPLNPMRTAPSGTVYINRKPIPVHGARADWRPTTLRDYLDGLIWRNWALTQQEDTLGLGRSFNEGARTREARNIANSSPFSRPSVPQELGNPRLRAIELIQNLTDEELDQEIPDDVDFAEFFHSLVASRAMEDSANRGQSNIIPTPEPTRPDPLAGGGGGVQGATGPVANAEISSRPQAPMFGSENVTLDSNGNVIGGSNTPPPNRPPVANSGNGATPPTPPNATVATIDELRPALQHLGDVRSITDVAEDVKVRNNPIIRFIVGRLQINPSVLFNSPIGKLVVAKYRQDIAIEELTNASVAKLDAFTRKGGLGKGNALMRADKNGMITIPDEKGNIKVHWNDVVEKLDDYKTRLSPAQVRYAQLVRQIIEDTRMLREMHGLSNLPAERNGRLWVPRVVKTAYGLEIQKPTNHKLDRMWIDATEGMKHGISYADPRETIKLYVYDTYRDIVTKQFSDAIENVAPSVETLINPRLLANYKTMKTAYESERNKLKDIILQYKNSGDPRSRDENLRVMLKNQRERVKATRARYNAFKEKYDAAISRTKSQELDAARSSSIRTFNVPGGHAVVVSPNDAKILNNYIGALGFIPSQQENIFTRTIGTAGKIVRTTTSTLDFAAPFTHNLPSLFANPKGWAKSTVMQYAAYLDPAIKARYMANNQKYINEMAAYGVNIGQSEYFEGAARNGPLEKAYRNTVGRVPVARTLVGTGIKQTAGRFETAMETALLVNRVELWKALKEDFENKPNMGFMHLGSVPGVRNIAGATENRGLEGLAQLVRNVTGALDSRALMVDSNHRDFESVWMAFSPKLFRSTVALFGMAMKPNTREGRVALRTLSFMASGTVATFYMLNKMNGASDEEALDSINPSSGKKFLAVKSKDDGTYYGIGGQVRAISSLLYNTGETLKNRDFQNFSSWNQFDNPILNFYTSRGAPAVSFSQNVIESSTGVNANPFEEVNGPKGMLVTTARDSLPFIAQNYLQGKDILGGDPADPQYSNASLIASANGLRTVPFSRAEERDLTIESQGFKMSDGSPAKKVTDLNNQQKEEFYNNYPVYKIDPKNDNVTKYFTAIDNINKEFDKQVNTMTMAVDNGNMNKEQFRKWYKDANSTRYAAINGVKEGFSTLPADRSGFKGSVTDYLNNRNMRPEDKAVNDYYSISSNAPMLPNGQIDFDALAKKKNDFMKGLSPETRTYVEEMTSSARRDRAENALMTEYDIVKQITKPYFEAENEVFNYMRGASKFFSQFNDIEQYKTWLDSTAQEMGITTDTLSAVLGSKYPDIKAFDKIETNYKKVLRLSNPQMDRALVDWYGLEPANRLEYTLGNFGLTGGEELATSVASNSGMNSTKRDLALGLSLKNQGYQRVNYKFRRPYYSLK